MKFREKFKNKIFFYSKKKSKIHYISLIVAINKKKLYFISLVFS